MPNKNEHALIGTAAGGTFAFLRSTDQDPLWRLLEAIGGSIGGRVASVLPDLVDPADHPMHREIGHGVAPGVVLSRWYYGSVCVPAQQHLRAEARLHFDAAASETGWRALGHWLWAAILVVLSGAVAGALAGYLSHLAADAFTTRSLPLLA